MPTIKISGSWLSGFYLNDEEMTTQEKQQFFALYWGQKVIRSVDGKGNLITRGLYPVQSSEMHDHFFESECYLELKSLDQITDEDAKELAQYMFIDDFLKRKPDEYIIKRVRNSISSGYFVLDQQKTDSLRSRGYLLPWKNYSINDLINEGVVKIKQGNG